MKPGVSVVIPILNAEGSIARCVESVLDSQYEQEELEVICVDNGSRDRTADILRSFQPRIRTIEERRRGPAAARNAGLRAASREFVAFTDADCYVDALWLANILKPLRSGAGAAGGRILARPEAGPVEMFGELIHDHARAIESNRPPYLISMNMASRLALIRSIGMFREGWIRMEDCEIAYRILGAGQRIAYEADAVVYHHNRDSLPTLAREGFLHGYYTPEFHRVHRNFIESYRNETAEERVVCHPPERLNRDRRLACWQLRLYWGVFRASKAAGMWAGRWFPPRIE